jgi:LacI family transcriptional regulator
MDRAKKLSINDVARLAGVSKKTVSRVINNEPGVSSRMLKKVQNVIDEYNYTPSRQARALSLSRSFLVSVIHDNPNASFVTEALYGALEICRPEGYELIVHPCDFSKPDTVDEIVSFVSNLKIDGVILLPPVSESADLTRRLREIGCNFVRVLSTRSEDDAHLIYHDDGAAVSQIVSHLVQLRHREIAIIRGPENSQSADQRFKDFRSALANNGLELPKNHIALGHNTFDSGIECAEWLLGSNRPPTAIFANNDEMAIGAIVTAQKKGMKIPGELTVVGFDDSPQASKMWPALTTANQHVREMAELAAQKLIAQCNGDIETAAGIRVAVEPTFVQRQTTDVPATHAAKT